MSTTPPLAGIDWQALRQRVEQTAAGLGNSPDSDREQCVLRERARRLAQADSPDAPLEETLTVLEVRLARERWAIEATHVRRVERLSSLTPLPSAPPTVRGLVTVRGELLPVIDIARLIDLPPCGLTDLNRLVVLAGAAGHLAVLVDEVVGLRLLARSDLRPAPPLLAIANPAFLLGITPDRTAVLDVERLLADPGPAADRPTPP